MIAVERGTTSPSFSSSAVQHGGSQVADTIRQAAFPPSSLSCTLFGQSEEALAAKPVTNPVTTVEPAVRRPDLQSRTHVPSLDARSQPPRSAADATRVECADLELCPDKDAHTEDPFFKTPFKNQAVNTAHAFRVKLCNPEAVVVPDSQSCPTSPLKLKGGARHSMVNVNISVIGAPRVGKSTFMRRAFNLSAEELSQSKARTFSINGILYKVRLFELALADFHFSPNGHLRWPTTFPDVHGVIALYDVTDPASLVELPQLLIALAKNQTPTILVSTKCDNPPSIHHVDPSIVEERAKILIDGIKVLQTSDTDLGCQHRCVCALLRQVAYDTFNFQARPCAPRRSKTSALRHVSSHSSNGDNAAAHEDSSFSLQRSASYNDVSMFTTNRMSQVDSILPSTPKNSCESTMHEKLSQKAVADPVAVRPVLQCQTSSLSNPKSSDEDSARSFLNLEDSPGCASRSSSASELSLRTSAQDGDYQSAPTFEDLVDQLLIPPRTKAQSRFPNIFFMFYHIFASPSQLLNAIIERFNIVKIDPPTDKTESSKDRAFLVLDFWINTYPGDFARLATQSTLRAFLARVAQDHKFVAAAHQITLALEAVVEDDDTEWVHSDGKSDSRRRSRSGTVKTFFSTSSCESIDTFESDTITSYDASTPPCYLKDSAAASIDAKLIFGGNSTLTLNAMGPSLPTLNDDDPSLSPSQSSINVAGSAQRQAALLSPSPVVPFTKAQWRALMGQTEDSIARELTRIDWIMFSSIRPRGLVRHVLVPPSDRSRFASLNNVTRMIEHFNHLAYWVTNLILLRDKAKHRAQALEKLMLVARKLRELNNYNAMGAVVAGIQCSAVHRLSQTRELIPPAVAKDFLKLEILMSTQKGHFAYRLAWDNTTSERIPFLPLHRRDLVVADAGNKTFLSDDHTGGPAGASAQALPLELDSGEISKSRRKINWRKFEVMGDMLSTFQRAQTMPYTGFSVNEEVRALILDGRIMKDDDELYERSVGLEVGAGADGTSGGAAGIVKKKFTRLTRYGLGERSGAPGVILSA